MLVPLVYTVPNHNSAVVDSNVVCAQLGELTADVDSVFLWAYPVVGGKWTVGQKKSIRHREGQQDTLWVDIINGAHFYVQVSDTVGNVHCISNVVFLPGAITGVEDPPTVDYVVMRKLFDVQGRLVKAPKLNGWYYEKVWYKSGRVIVTKLLWVHGKRVVFDDLSGETNGG